MPRFWIRYEVDEPDLNMATQVAYLLLYDHGYQPLSVDVTPIEHPGRAFGEKVE